MQTPTSQQNQIKYEAETDALTKAVQAARKALRDAEAKLAKHLRLSK